MALTLTLSSIKMSSSMSPYLGDENKAKACSMACCNIDNSPHYRSEEMIPSRATYTLNDKREMDILVGKFFVAT